VPNKLIRMRADYLVYDLNPPGGRRDL